MKLIMENWKGFLLSEGAKGIADLPEGVYISVQGNKDLFQVSYTDEKGKDGVVPHGKIVCQSVSEKVPCSGAMQIGLAYATRGWGPLLYDVAMEYATMVANGLTAGRLSVSGLPNRRG